MKKGRRKLFGLTADTKAAGDGGEAGELSGILPLERAEGLQRLQVGLFGIAAMVLLVGLASIIGSQADRAEQAAVPDAAPTTEPTAIAPGAGAGPAGDAVVVPDIPAEPSPAPLLDPLVLPPPTASPAASPAAAPGASAKP